ncbi:MAG: 2'-deoxycytidine 5'-triphosphate deaminase domain-containing protein, partial [Solirubrobacteraceae bacterium]
VPAAHPAPGARPGPRARALSDRALWDTVVVPTSVLSDGTIRRLVDEGRIVIDPWDPGLIQPASVDLRLGDSFRVFHNHRAAAIDLREPPQGLTEEVKASSEGFVIHPGEFCLGRTLEWVELPNDVVARIEGKALALDTPVPTPAGWRMMGDLRVGDLVFDAEGEPTPIAAATPVMEGRECREVVFSDGITIVADIDHQWEVLTKNDRRRGAPPRVVSTREIERTLRCSRTEYNHHVVQAGPVRYDEKDLLVDPYVLGVWLGDGTSANAEITTVDEPILAEIVAAGYAVRHASGPLAYRVGGVGHTRDPQSGRYTPNDSLNSRLRELGVLGDKHIPVDYLQGSVEQRRALLQGLMDADGHADVYGRCELTTVNGRLADQYCELAASLGFKPHLSMKTVTLNGRSCGLAFLVKFTPHEAVFRLPRKLARQKLGGRFYMGRTIVDVRPTHSVPVRCIEVASPRGVYLVTEAFIPTHNSSLGRLGLIVHATAGFIDPGWKGTLTLELNNLTRVPIKLYPELLIAQLSFMALDAPAERPYGSEALGSHYQGQVAATESRYMR